MSAPIIDLNSDLGESEEAAQRAVDLALLDAITSANIACGGHAGSPATMRATILAAIERGVAIGAHPGYPDRANFGRVEVAMPPAEIERMVHEQVAALAHLAAAAGAPITHVKPHGALYHAAMFKPEIARAIAAGALRAAPDAWLVGLAGAPGLEVWRAAGASVAAEAFADRRYEANGALRARTHSDALITDVQQAAAQAIAIARHEPIQAAGGATVCVRAQTICVHSDTPGAVGVAQAVRHALERSGIRVARLPT